MVPDPFFPFAPMLKEIQSTPKTTELRLIATGPYLGEGFDCPRIDTLLLAFPVSFKGKLGPVRQWNSAGTRR